MHKGYRRLYPVWRTRAWSPFSHKLLATMSHPRVPLPATTNGCVSFSPFNISRNSSSDSPKTFTKGIPTCDIDGCDIEASTSSWNSIGPFRIRVSNETHSENWGIKRTGDHKEGMWGLRRHSGWSRERFRSYQGCLEWWVWISEYRKNRELRMRKSRDGPHSIEKARWKKAETARHNRKSRINLWWFVTQTRMSDKYLNKFLNF